MFDKVVKGWKAFRGMPRLLADVETLRYELDMARSKMDLPDDIIETFQKDRATSGYAAAFEKARPLVSVCIGTYNRRELLVNRSLWSIRRQTYDNLQIVVVGDCCTDDTEEAVAQLRDGRIVFVNLPQRGPYPSDPMMRWMVAGTNSVNHALGLSTGDFVTHLDDDDEYSPDRIEKLVAFIQSTKADLVFHPFRAETQRGRWRTKVAREFRSTQVTTSSIFYHNWFKRIPWDINAFKYREPGDWNRFRKIRYIGARIERYPEMLLTHYKERAQSHR